MTRLGDGRGTLTTVFTQAEAAQADLDGFECSSYTWQARHHLYLGITYMTPADAEQIPDVEVDRIEWAGDDQHRVPILHIRGITVAVLGEIPPEGTADMFGGDVAKTLLVEAREKLPGVALVTRDIASATDHRTAIAALVPRRAGLSGTCGEIRPLQRDTDNLLALFRGGFEATLGGERVRIVHVEIRESSE